MSKSSLITTFLASVVLAGPAVAGPHLGMKLACKHYGDAWNSGSRSALYGQVTGDFAHQFQRMPDDMFRTMPRGGGGQVLSHSKNGSSGRVTVATSHGVVTFAVVGSGFKWRVADIYKPGDDGRTVSLKSYLDASMTAHEFIRDLTKRTDKQFMVSTSNAFDAAFAELKPEELQMVRELIPNVKLQGKPYLSMNGSRATMQVHLVGDRRATLQLVREGSWKVEDYGVESPTMSVASFRNSLDTIVAVQRFRQFMVEPKSHHPELFVSAGSLRDSLVRVHELGFLPMHQKPSPMRHCRIDADGQNVHIELADRKVHLTVDRKGVGATVTKAEVTMGNRWADLGHLIALNERFRTSFGVIGMAQPRIPASVAVAEVAPAAKEESVLVNASATEIEPSESAAEVAIRPASTTPAISSPEKPVVQPATYVAPRYEVSRPVYRNHRVLKKFRRR